MDRIASAIWMDTFANGWMLEEEDVSLLVWNKHEMKRSGNQKTTDKGIKFPGVAEPNVLIVVEPERMASSLNA